MFDVTQLIPCLPNTFLDICLINQDALKARIPALSISLSARNFMCQYMTMKKQGFFHAISNVSQ